MSKAIPVLFNPGSGRGGTEKKLSLLRDAFAAAGADFQPYVVRNALEAQSRVDALLADDHKLIAAGGGDGTISAVAGCLVGSGASLGVMPMGTLNHFAKDVGIPDDLNQAVRVLLSGAQSRIDVASVNGRYFINNAGVGFYSWLVRHRSRRQNEGMGKWTAAAAALVGLMRRYRLIAADIIIDGNVVPVRSPFVFIGNNAYEVSGFRLGSRSSLNEGKLSVCFAHLATPAEAVGLVWDALTGSVRSKEYFYEYRTDRVELRMSSPAVRVAADGELEAIRTPLLFRAHPGALSVLVPS